MKRSSITRWATAVAASAMLALPVSAFAQSTGSQPPATGTQPPTSTSQPPATGAAQEPAGQVDADAAKQHLTAARNSLSEMTQLPAASQLTGDARTQVSQLITNFNELITTKADWRTSFSKVETNLNALIGSATTDEAAARTSGTEGAVGTSGTVSGLDPALKAKLVDFRNHLDKFEKAAGGKANTPPDATDPAAAAATSSSGTGAAASTSGTATMAGSSGAATAATAPPQQPAAAAPSQSDKDELLRHVSAIETILSGQTSASAGTSTSGTVGTSGTTGASATQSPVTLTAAQVEQLKTHLSELKRLLNQR
jgi:hypothetical protein